MARIEARGKVKALLLLCVFMFGCKRECRMDTDYHYSFMYGCHRIECYAARVNTLGQWSLWDCTDGLKYEHVYNVSWNLKEGHQCVDDSVR